MASSLSTEASFTMQTSPYLNWYQTGRLSRYVDGIYTPGAMGSTLISATQPAGDMSDPAVDEIVLAYSPDCNRDAMAQIDAGTGTLDCSFAGENLIVFPPNYANSIIIDRPHKATLLSLPSYEAKKALENTNLSPNLDFGLLHAGMFQDSFLIQSLNRLRDWCSPEHASFGLAREGLVLAILLRMAELAGNAKLAALPHKHGMLATWQIKRVTERLQTDLAASATLEELATLVGLSKFHFCRAFSQTMGCSPMQYLIDQRLALATTLLKTSTLAIADVAAQIGYDDPSYFTRLYRLKNGVTPKTIRQVSQ
jgi:AraC family transcriptional regulator